jgi:peptidoglycan hydrolase CwlO-like protein
MNRRKFEQYIKQIIQTFGDRSYYIEDCEHSYEDYDQRKIELLESANNSLQNELEKVQRKLNNTVSKNRKLNKKIKELEKEKINFKESL